MPPFSGTAPWVRGEHAELASRPVWRSCCAESAKQMAVFSSMPEWWGAPPPRRRTSGVHHAPWAWGVTVRSPRGSSWRIPCSRNNRRSSRHRGRQQSSSANGRQWHGGHAYHRRSAWVLARLGRRPAAETSETVRGRRKDSGRAQTAGDRPAPPDAYPRSRPDVQRQPVQQRQEVLGRPPGMRCASPSEERA